MLKKMNLEKKDNILLKIKKNNQLIDANKRINYKMQSIFVEYYTNLDIILEEEYINNLSVKI
jgi:hypothetical protein